MSEDIDVEHHRGSRHSMVFDTAFSLNKDVNVQASFPELVMSTGSENKLEWTLGEKQNTTVDADYVQELTENVEILVSPMSQVKTEVEWTEGVISAMPIHVDYSVKFDDNSEHTFKLEGFQDQTTSAGYKLGKKEVQLPEGNVCGKMETIYE